MKAIRLRAGKDRSLLHHHPWVFSGSIASGKADLGETVRVESHDGRFLAWGAYSPASNIKVRVWSFIESERIDAPFFVRRVQAAVALRARLAIDSDAMRLVHGEADGLPGLVVDRYADTLCVQFLFAGTERWKDCIADALMSATGAARLYERSDAGVRALEGLKPLAGWLRGTGETWIDIREHAWRLRVDVAHGHKTGFYLDQRDNRQHFAALVRQFGCAEVLNCFCYTGGFSLAALSGGAEQVTSVDSSAPALVQAAAHVRLNGFDASRHITVDADVNRFLRSCLEQGRGFDAIVLDPPKFAPTAAHAERAARAYKDINRLALLLLRPGGLLLSFSCSAGIGVELFQQIAAAAAADAQVECQVLQRLAAGGDHPFGLQFPEGDYLKGLVIHRTASHAATLRQPRVCQS
jgi:23S rRNA (cytosine1962-C5)-methyltransferase